MFQKVADAGFIRGEHQMLRFWQQNRIFQKLREKNRGKPKWSFLDGPITANNPMGVHHAWGRTYKDAYQRYFAMTGHELRYQNGFDCQGLWVEVEVEKELGLGTKKAILDYGIDRFVDECKKRVLRFAARQTEQSIRLGFWMDWDDPDTLRQLAEALGTEEEITIRTPSGTQATDKPHQLVGRLGKPEWGGSYFTFSTENNETIWTFLKKCFNRQKIYRGHDVMPWSGRGGSAYSQMEVADGRRLSVHKSCFVRLPIIDKASRRRKPAGTSQENDVENGREHPEADAASRRRKPAGMSQANDVESVRTDPEADASGSPEYLLVWTTTPWTLTANVACAVNPDLEYVKLRAKRDGAVYYFAAENLDYQRLGREFKEGFGRPEWQWPKDVPKLKTIRQIFKEQGGCEVEGTIKGAEMIGWRYEGPFDDLPAQYLAPGEYTGGGHGSLERRPPAVYSRRAKYSSAAEAHRVIDGGRDNRGNPNVVAGEGTGIVHMAPGCGDVDHQIGMELGLPVIAPLEEDGTFSEGFGEFTGEEAIDPGTAKLVFEKLREKGMLVYVEDYPHIYPHCWRTGDELVFRLVDEWFINMDWREEIKEVTRAITWLPPEVQGQERELEWLTNMRDWMISKKRFWGLALPVWVDEESGDFEVIGSLEELKERAVEGWEKLEGNTPHRPWIDAVKIKNPKTGNLMSRIPDVGNPWLDAGIVPFSTMHYNTDRTEWQKWYPADFVTECFPGQFRNWFYSLLATATMMRYDETDDPKEKRPFKTLLGHRLVMNEEGQPMHKSDGTAIWFEEAAEQLGVDTMRWMYLAQNPAQDLRFGTRHPDEPTTIETPEGEIEETKEGLPICRVTSKPSDEVRRQILIPLWNSYKFFVNYAIADEFDPNGDPVAYGDRPEIDRWILSNLQALITTCRQSFEAFDVAAVCRASAAFIDDLSNWYIRRNRRRFWRKREESASRRREPAGASQASDVESVREYPEADASGSPGEADASGSPETQLVMDADKLAAYQTLHEVLVTLTKLLAPVVPFLSERMYGNLVSQGRTEFGHSQDRAASARTPARHEPAPESVHLCDYPEANERLLDSELNERMALAQRVVRLGHRAREESNIRVRQPLSELRIACPPTACGLADPKAAIHSLQGIVKEELNVKELTPRNNLGDLIRYQLKPNLKTLGPKYGKLLPVIREKLPQLPAETFAPLQSGENVTIGLDGDQIVLLPEDVLIETEQAPGWQAAEDAGLQVALNTELTPELKREGMARDFVRQVQNLRKRADLDIADRIRIFYQSDDPAVQQAIEQWSEYICQETLADALETSGTAPEAVKSLSVGQAKARIWIEKP